TTLFRSLLLREKLYPLLLLLLELQNRLPAYLIHLHLNHFLQYYYLRCRLLKYLSVRTSTIRLTTFSCILCLLFYNKSFSFNLTMSSIILSLLCPSTPLSFFTIFPSRSKERRLG